MPESERDLLIRIDERTERMHTELLGPTGRVPKLEDVTDKHASQINFWRGVMWILAGLVTVFGAVIVEHVLASGGK